MKHILFFSKLRIQFSFDLFISTFNASRTSAEPDFDVIDLLPCLATFIPAPATTIEDAVEILNVPE